ncbi:hypothetical protein HZ326_11755 [Fusarium oxysporum f. sp. albedinis]|nr:hypothetical protein HZ326_11755 [Fusarium oxysporum f. sp. albedinis]
MQPTETVSETIRFPRIDIHLVILACNTKSSQCHPDLHGDGSVFLQSLRINLTSASSPPFCSLCRIAIFCLNLFFDRHCCFTHALTPG